MHILELKAKVKPGKEKELNQVIKDLIPNFNSFLDLQTQVDFNEEEGELNFRLSNGSATKRIKEILDNQNFILFLGSIKVLCDGYTLILPNNNE
jgi:hypothetical protein